MNKETIDKCASLDVRKVMEFYGIRFDSRGFAVCPFHREKTASLTIKGNHYKCFGCQAYGGPIDFVKEYFGLDFLPAVIRLCTDFCIENEKRNYSYSEKREWLDQKLLDEAEEKWEKYLDDIYDEVCLLYRIYYRLQWKGHKWVEPIVDELDRILDDFSGEEARRWAMIFKQM